MALFQNISLLLTTIFFMGWAYIFLTGNADAYKQNFGKEPTADVLLAYRVGGLNLATVCFVNLAALLFHGNAVKRLMLRACTLLNAGALYHVYISQEHFLPEAVRLNYYLSGFSFVICFISGFILSPPVEQKKKRF